MHVVDWLRLNARRYPRQPAYIVGEDVRTWEQIDTRSDRLAGRLQALGVQAGDRVAFLGPNGFEAVECWYGTLKAEALFVGLNTRLSTVEIARQLQDCCPSVFFFHADFAPMAHAVIADAPALIATIGFGDGHGAELEYEKVAGTGPACDMNALSWTSDIALFYTSGSTGAPKAVICSNDRLVHTLYNTMLLWGFRPDDVYLHNAGAANLAIMFATWNSVLGIPSVLLPTFDPLEELRQIERHRVTVFANVVTMLERLLEHPQLGSFDLSSLRLVNYGSMPASPTLPHRAREALGCDLLQLYGMTEGLGFFSCLTPEDHRRALAPEADNAILRSAGRPLPHTDVRIVGAQDLEELEAGQTGEICIRSPSVSRGYWQNPSETAARFRSGWLHTGDVGHIDEQGYLYVTGRQDWMIVSGGFNVFPGEVERVIGTHREVAEVCVVGVPSEAWGHEVQAFVRIRGAAEQRSPADERRIEGEIDKLCREQLARFKAPKRVRFVDSLPYGPTGKIRRRELIEWAVGGPPSRLS